MKSANVPRAQTRVKRARRQIAPVRFSLTAVALGSLSW
jgi:hypothetical protein